MNRTLVSTLEYETSKANENFITNIVLRDKVFSLRPITKTHISVQKLQVNKKSKRVIQQVCVINSYIA